MKIMNIKQLFAASLCLMAFAACSSDDTQTAQNAERYPIRLSNNLVTPSADETRASGTYASGFTTGNVFWVWADMFDEGESDPLYQTKEFVSAWRLTVNSTDNSTFDAVNEHTFPVYNKLSFYAMHGNFANTITQESTNFPGLLTHVVRADQRSDNDFLLSDLVYAIKPDVVPQSDVVPLQFYHLLSKVEVSLKPGNRISADEINDVAATKVTVSLVGTRTHVKFTPKKNVATTINTEAGRLTMISVDDEVDPEPITLSTITSNDFSACAAAVVAPQTVNGHFVCLNYQGHDTYFDVTNLELKSGYRYRFNLTVDRIGETFVVTPNLIVTPWGDEQVVDADLNNLIGTSTL